MSCHWCHGVCQGLYKIKANFGFMALIPAFWSWSWKDAKFGLTWKRTSTQGWFWLVVYKNPRWLKKCHSIDARNQQPDTHTHTYTFPPWGRNKTIFFSFFLFSSRVDGEWLMHFGTLLHQEHYLYCEGLKSGRPWLKTKHSCLGKMLLITLIFGIVLLPKGKCLCVDFGDFSWVLKDFHTFFLVYLKKKKSKQSCCCRRPRRCYASW